MKRTHINWFCVVGAIAVLICASASTQPPKPPSTGSAGQEQKTQLEPMQSQSGTVVIKGYTETGYISGSPVVSVNCVEMADLSTHARWTGMTIELWTLVGVRSLSKESVVSYIDYDRIEPLLKGIDYIAKVRASPSKLARFEATYRDQGSFSISTKNDDDDKGTVIAVVTCGSVVPVSRKITMAELAEIKAMIVKAKEKLDSIK